MSKYTVREDYDLENVGGIYWTLLYGEREVGVCPLHLDETHAKEIAETLNTETASLREENERLQAELEAERNKDRLSKLDYSLWEVDKLRLAKQQAEIERLRAFVEEPYVTKLYAVWCWSRMVASDTETTQCPSQCPNCSGTGIVNDPYTAIAKTGDCPECDGTGIHSENGGE